MVPKGLFDRSVSIAVSRPEKSSTCPDKSNEDIIFVKFDSVPPVTQTSTARKHPALPLVLMKTDPGGSGSGVLEITDAWAVFIPQIASPRIMAARRNEWGR